MVISDGSRYLTSPVWRFGVEAARLIVHGVSLQSANVFLNDGVKCAIPGGITIGRRTERCILQCIHLVLGMTLNCLHWVI